MSEEQEEQDDFEYGRNVAKNATMNFFGPSAMRNFRSIFTPYRVLRMYDEIDKLRAAAKGKGDDPKDR